MVVILFVNAPFTGLMTVDTLRVFRLFFLTFFGPYRKEQCVKQHRFLTCHPKEVTRNSELFEYVPTVFICIRIKKDEDRVLTMSQKSYEG